MPKYPISGSDQAAPLGGHPFGLGSPGGAVSGPQQAGALSESNADLTEGLFDGLDRPHGTLFHSHTGARFF